MGGCLGALLILFVCFAILYLALDMLIWVVCTVFGLVFSHGFAIGLLALIGLIVIIKKLLK